MTSIEYEDLFSYFLGYITDYSLVSLDEDDALELMSEYLHKAISADYISRLFSSLTLDDNFQVIDFELLNPVSDSSDFNFVMKLFSKAMVVEWLTPQVRSKMLTAQMIGGKEQKWFSQAAHLKELRELLEDTEIEVRKLIRDRGYIYNSYLG